MHFVIHEVGIKNTSNIYNTFSRYMGIQLGNGFPITFLYYQSVLERMGVSLGVCL